MTDKDQAPLPARPRIALALGGGGARGLAHIAVLEALEALDIRPVAVAGTSIGAIVGVAYAAGFSPAMLRRHVLACFRDRTEVLTRLFRARVGTFADLVRRGGNPVLVDGERVLTAFWPAPMPATFEELTLPFFAVATDFYAREACVLSKGPLLPAVAASMAIPGLVKPVELDGRILIDGGPVDPLPFGVVAGLADLVIAVDVTGDAAAKTGPPGPIEAMFGAAQIMQSAVIASRLAGHGARIQVLKPAVGGFAVLDFFAARRIFSAAEPIKQQLSTLLHRDD